MISICVVIILKMNTIICQKQSWNLSQTSYSPISKPNSMVTRLERQERRNKWLDNCIRPLIICANSWKFFEVVTNAPPEKVMSVLSREHSFEKVKVFCKVKVNKSEIAQGEFPISNKLLQIIYFGLNFRENLSFSSFPVRVSEKSAHFFECIIDNSNQIFH